MRVTFSRFVETDLETIADYPHDNPRRAVSFIHEIREKIRAIGSSVVGEGLEQGPSLWAWRDRLQVRRQAGAP